MKTFTAYVEWDPETNQYVEIVPGIAGAHTQAETLDELRMNLKEVLELCLEEYQESDENLPHNILIHLYTRKNQSISDTTSFPQP